MSRVNCGSAVRFGQALAGFLITAPPPVLVPAVLGALAVWISNQKKKIMLVSAVLGTLGVWIKPTKDKKEERNSNAQHQSSFSETN